MRRSRGRIEETRRRGRGTKEEGERDKGGKPKKRVAIRWKDEVWKEPVLVVGPRPAGVISL